MPDLRNQTVLVASLDPRGQAACELLLRLAAHVVAVDGADTPALREVAAALRRAGAQVELGVATVPEVAFELAVVSSEVPRTSPLLAGLTAREVPVIGELELGFQHARCLTLAIAGTNGKSTTADLLQRLLAHEHRQSVICGPEAQPACAAVNQGRELDFLILQATAQQLAATHSLRPSVAVLLNLWPDAQAGHASHEDYVRAQARLFANQQSSDWAIVQCEALAQLTALGLTPRGKVVTFSAHDSAADLYVERGLLISRIDGWSGPLLDMDHGQLRGPHNAENLMAALAAGRALRLPLEGMVSVLRTVAPLPHRCEIIAEPGGVRFISDAAGTNLHALTSALRSVAPAAGGLPNVWLIAGGPDHGLDFHSVGPLISQRVKGAFLLGEAREQLRAAWGLFTPCMLVASLAEAAAEAAKRALPGDVVLFSPASAGVAPSGGAEPHGEVFRQAVYAICSGDNWRHPN